MKKDIKGRIRQFIKVKNITVQIFEQSIGRSNGYLAHIQSPTSNTLFDIATSYPDISMDWLITGQGEMYKSKYNVSGDAHITDGDNKGVIGNTGTNTGTINSHQITVPGNAKKIIEADKTTIEMSEFSEILKDNEHLRTRVKDLEETIASQKEVISSQKEIIAFQKKAIGDK
ncbi:MAG: hypothetical protein LBV11_17420 [Bacillus cereus]|jgi:hypothetical protein|nr:hypothetical protein [Bacillus cereus]